MTVITRPRVLLASIMIISAALAALYFEPLSRAIGIANPDAVAMHEARIEFARAIEAPRSEDWHGALSEQGLRPSVIGDPIPATRIEEIDEDCVGRGSYLLSHDEGARPILMSAPHRGYDRYTGTLALQLVGEGGLAAGAWNSAPRKARKACRNAADLARSPLNHFTAFALAFSDSYPAGRIVQLHGFDRSVRQSQAGAEADVILSNGTENAGENLFDIADCMSASFARRNVLVYPNDVRELGALTNAQGQALREDGFGSFVHVELSLSLRRELVDDPEARRAFLGCLSIGIAG